MLTKDQMDEWAEQVDYARGYTCDRIASPWANAIIAVDTELAALRTEVTTLVVTNDKLNRMLSEVIKESRQQVEELQGERVESQVALQQATRMASYADNTRVEQAELISLRTALKAAREALVRYADKDNWEWESNSVGDMGYTFTLEGADDEDEDAWGIAQRALAAIDAVLGSKEESK